MAALASSLQTSSSMRLGESSCTQGSLGVELLGRELLQAKAALIANFTWVRPEIECRGESCIRPAPRPHWAITRIAPTEEDACN